MPAKVVVIGSNGLLGQTLVMRLLNHPDYTVTAMAAGKNRNNALPKEKYFQIDLSDFKTITEYFENIKPHFIINALAMTNVDSCEIEKELCDKVNTAFVEQLTTVCRVLNAHLIHISTDFIFDGIKGNYIENDQPCPVNYYGWSKLRSEKVIWKNISNYTILRTILVYGKVAEMKQQNIVLWVKNSLEKGENIRIVNDQFRMPTYVGTLADACLLAMKHQATGVYHISGSELLSIYEIALRVARFFGLPETLIQPIATEKLNQKAKRPPKTGFVLGKAINELGFKPLSLQQGLLLLEADLQRYS